MKTLSTQTMLFNARQSVLSGEASTLEFTPVPAVEVVSHFTGRKEIFRLVETVRDREGDVMHWVYAPLSAALRVAELLIFND